MKSTYFYALIFTLIFTSCGDTVEQQTTAQIRPVKYAKLGMSNDAQTQRFAGFAKAAVEAKLSFRANGQIESLNVKVGEKVKKGQLIAQLDDRDASLSYQQAKASLENARVQRANAQSSLTRIRQLYQSNNISLAEYEQAKNQFASANASYESAEKALDLQASQLSYFKLFAPISGIVSAVNNEINEVVQAGSPIVVLSAGQDVEIEVGIPEAYISQIEQDDSVAVRFASVEEEVFRAKVSEISFAVDASRNTYPVTVVLDNPSSEVRPGMAGDVSFFFSKGNTAQLVLPVNALADGPDGNFVFVIEEINEGKGTIKKQPLEVGELLPGGFEIKSGVSTGTFVATAGLSSLLDGMEVKLME